MIELNYLVVVTDVFLTLICFITERLSNEANTSIYLSVWLLTSAYLKVPFTFCLCLHHFRLRALLKLAHSQKYAVVNTDEVLVITD
jgi:hypothetical protein